MKGHIKIELFDEEGNLKSIVEKDNTFMAVGDAHVADQLDVSPDEAAMGFMSVGTGSTAFTTASTTLNSEIDKNALNSSYPDQAIGAADNDIVYKANWAAGDATGAITEAGIFNSSVTDAGTMLAASTFSVINKGASDTLTITWTVTVGAS
ncbi:MAG: hypothetical protein KJI72_04205 [Patescibacteria group bacterium]|nr:hypothetical protein [Patescibacteria group bacterium]